MSQRLFASTSAEQTMHNTEHTAQNTLIYPPQTQPTNTTKTTDITHSNAPVVPAGRSRHAVERVVGTEACPRPQKHAQVDSVHYHRPQTLQIRGPDVSRISPGVREQ
eukprot:2096022-Rhodomonas_salina.1